MCVWGGEGVLEWEKQIEDCERVGEGKGKVESGRKEDETHRLLKDGVKLHGFEELLLLVGEASILLVGRALVMNKGKERDEMKRREGGEGEEGGYVWV